MAKPSKRDERQVKMTKGVPRPLKGNGARSVLNRNYWENIRKTKILAESSVVLVSFSETFFSESNTPQTSMLQHCR